MWSEFRDVKEVKSTEPADYMWGKKGRGESRIVLLGQPQWFILVIPVLWKAEGGGSLEARSSKLAWTT